MPLARRNTLGLSDRVKESFAKLAIVIVFLVASPVLVPDNVKPESLIRFPVVPLKKTTLLLTDDAGPTTSPLPPPPPPPQVSHT